MPGVVLLLTFFYLPFHNFINSLKTTCGVELEALYIGAFLIYFKNIFGGLKLFSTFTP